MPKKVIRMIGFNSTDICIEMHTDEVGRWHSPDGDKPAVVTKHGMQIWAHHGRIHRGGGLPAIIHAGGEEEFVFNGNVQRLIQGEISV